MNIEQIARVCHEANRGYCESIGDPSQKSWDNAEEWQRQSAIAGVKFTLDNPQAPASAQHENWMADKIQDGWEYGPVKNPAIKQHPCLVPYAALPLEQRLKDHLFKAVVKAFVEVS